MSSEPTLDATHPPTGNTLLVTNFTGDGTEPGWHVVNDNVMGGRSEGGFDIADGSLHFSGRTNTNGGGFSSLRANVGLLDLSAYDGIRLTAKGDGRRYTWRLATDARYRGSEIGYWLDFDTRDGEWRVVDLPFSDFVPRFRGSRLDGPKLQTAETSSIGLMIYDNQDGPFDLRLASVQAYVAEAVFSLDQYRWKKRLIVVSAPDKEDAELMKLRAALTSTAEAFADRDMVLITLLDEGTSTAGDRDLNTEEAAAVRKALDLAPRSFDLRLIGKDGTVKLSADEAIPVENIYGLVDSMPMRQSEMSGN